MQDFIICYTFHISALSIITIVEVWDLSVLMINLRSELVPI
jgi:hypothetical protein